jgi:putative peptidoglycan lipid II flippase
LYFVLPITAIFFVLRAQVIRLVLGTGQFGWADTRLTAAALGIFAISVFAQSLIPLISRAFYSLHDTKTPVLISLVSIVLNIILSFCFVWALNKTNAFSNLFSAAFKLGGIKDFAVLGLPLAFSLSNILNFVILMKFFGKKSKEWNLKSILKSVYKIVISCVLMAVVIYGCLQIFDLFFDTQTFLGLFLQAGISAIIGIGIYFVVSLLYKLPEPISFMRRIFRRGYDTEQY